MFRQFLESAFSQSYCALPRIFYKTATMAGATAFYTLAKILFYFKYPQRNDIYFAKIAFFVSKTRK